MTDRDRLIELLIEGDDKCSFYTEIADFLIANGVTVQEWISVEERLPDSNTAVIVATVDGIVFQCLFGDVSWDLWETNRVQITHWQPLPTPPKGVE